MNRSFVPAFAALLVLAAHGTAVAQAPEDDSALRANCANDYFAFCSQFQPGSLEIKQCFGRNMRKLTPACQGAIRDFDRRNARGRRR